MDRRYKHYRNQMKAVVSSFEAVAGNGAATVYSVLALKAMSRHFKCSDGIIVGAVIGDDDENSDSSVKFSDCRFHSCEDCHEI